MRPFALLSAANSWAEDLTKLGLEISEIYHDPNEGIKSFIPACAAISKAGVVLVDASAYTGADIYFTGLANGLGIQVISIGKGTLSDILLTNPRNVCYDDFEQALERYFTTGRAAQGKEALR